MNLKEQIEKLLDLFQEVKREVRQNNKQFYERWKAGGYIIDSDVFSMYPNIEKFIEYLQDEEETDEEEENEENS